MKAIKRFDEFVKQNIVKKQSKDKSRAEFLIKESENRKDAVAAVIGMHLDALVDA